MVQYFDDYDLACVDGYSFRRDKKTGYYLSSKKIGGRRKRLHVYIWEKEHGKVPKGTAVHHVDEDKRNNELSNLTILPNSDHATLHDYTLSDDDREWRRKNVVQNAMPAAKEWHSSEEGKAWHSQHAKETMRKRKEKRYICSNCGEQFFTKHIYGASQNTFCSNKCKAAFRRKIGADNITKKCERCGNEFTTNKYQKRKYCKDCLNRMGHPRGRI